MKALTVLTAIAFGVTLTVAPALAQDRTETKPSGETAQPAKDTSSSDPSASPKTGGDTRPSAVDPAQSTKTGANAGEGASYNRSSEKGDSAAPEQARDK